MGVRLIVHENLSQYVTGHPDQLSLAIPLWIGTLSTGQRVVMFCGWGVKADMVRVWVAGKTVWSPCYHKPYLSALRYDRAVARILFQPRQRGRLNRGLGAQPPAESRGRPPIRGQWALPPEAQSFSVVGCPNEMENVLQFYYFTTYSLFSKNVLSCICTTMLWWSVIGRPFVKLLALCYRTVVTACLSVGL